MMNVCIWARMDDESDSWGTSCNHAFTIMEGTPKENEFRYCCYCGGELEESSID